jgi:hypothetical protein
VGDIKNALLAPRAGVETEDVEIPGVGVVTVRGLSRYEFALSAKGPREHDDLAQERFIIAAALVEPRMTEVEVEAWQKSSPPNEINSVALAINRLSGIGKDAAKSGVSDV